MGGEKTTTMKNAVFGVFIDFLSLCVRVCMHRSIQAAVEGKKKQGVCSLGDSGDGLLENHPP